MSLTRRALPHPPPLNNQKYTFMDERGWGEVAQGCLPSHILAYVRFCGQAVSWWSVEVLGALAVVFAGLLREICQIASETTKNSQ